MEYLKLNFEQKRNSNSSCMVRNSVSTVRVAKKEQVIPKPLLCGLLQTKTLMQPFHL